MRYPAAIVAFFAVVFAVNAAFIYIAVTGADEVEADYLDEANRK